MTSRPLPDGDLRSDARRLFGSDPRGYDRGRPDYPERVYEVLVERCGLRAGAEVLEIGPGTGRVTQRLAELGARVVAIEPDAVLAARLRAPDGPGAEVVDGTFEEIALPHDRFDLAVGAMSFHWVDPSVGLPKIGQAVRRDGFVALWWTSYGDESRPDPFDEAISTAVRRFIPDDGDDALPLELDVAWWKDGLAAQAGLVDVAAELIPWTARFDIDRLAAFYGSMIAVRRLAADERRELLATIASVAEGEFGGTVERPFITALYTGRRP